MGRITSSGCARNDQITRKEVSDQVTKVMMFLLLTYIKTTNWTRKCYNQRPTPSTSSGIRGVYNSKIIFSANFTLLHVSFPVDIYDAPFVADMFSFCH